MYFLEYTYMYIHVKISIESQQSGSILEEIGLLRLTVRGRGAPATAGGLPALRSAAQMERLAALGWTGEAPVPTRARPHMSILRRPSAEALRLP